MIDVLPAQVRRRVDQVVAELGIGERVAAVDAPVRHRRRQDVGLEAARLHLAGLIEEAARTRERHVLADDVEDGGVELDASAGHVETLAELDLPARLRIERRAVGLRLRQRPERVGERAVEIDRRDRLVDEADAARERFRSRRSSGLRSRRRCSPGCCGSCGGRCRTARRPSPSPSVRASGDPGRRTRWCCA